MKGTRGIGLASLAAVWITAAASAVSASAADAPKVAGDWQGTLKIMEVVELRLVFHVAEDEAGALTATMESPDQGTGKMPVASTTAKDGNVTFDLPKIRGKFTGKFDAKGETIEGTWAQNGQSTPLKLSRFDPSKVKVKAMVVPTEMEGIWEGKLEAGAGLQLRMVLKVVKGNDGKLTAAFRSPDQLDRDFPLTSLTLEGKKVTAVVKSLGSTFNGTLNDAKTEIKGEWVQAAAKLPLTLKKSDKESTVNRPQTPKGPFPYESIEVTYKDADGKSTLAGTLTEPKGKGPFPVAIMITGSGQQDRDETLFQHKPFAVIADHLTRRGIAVLRVDDRGVGGSTGAATTATSKDFADDVHAGIEYLKTRKEIDPKRIGLIGHSEGGLIAPIVAEKHPEDVAFIVMLAGPGLDGATIIKLQGSLIAKAMGAKTEALDQNAKLIDELIQISRSEKDETVATTKLKEATRRVLDKMTKDEKEKDGATGSESAALARVSMFASPWFRFFLAHDPREPLKKVKCPVLAINGEKDLQVPPKENLEAIARALDEGGNKNYVTKILPSLNHLFQTCKTGTPAEYAAIEETVAPVALELISDWVVKTTQAH